MHLDINTKEFCDRSLALAAEHTKVELETLSETFALYRRDLLFSEDSSRILLPIYTHDEPKSYRLFDYIRICAYIKEKFNSKIFLVIPTKVTIANCVYSLFSNYITKVIKCDRFIELNNIADNLGITKLMYKHSISPFHVINKKNFVEPISIDFNHIINNKSIMIDVNNSKDFCFSLGENEKLPLCIEDVYIVGKPNIYKDIEREFYTNVGKILSSKYYVNIRNKSIYDYIAPFFGTHIKVHGTPMYNYAIFKNSLSARKNRISKYEV